MGRGERTGEGDKLILSRYSSCAFIDTVHFKCQYSDRMTVGHVLRGAVRTVQQQYGRERWP